MIRVLAIIAALICAAPAIAQPLPANLDKANAIVIETTKGRIVIKLRTDIAPQHAERIKTLVCGGTIAAGVDGDGRGPTARHHQGHRRTAHWLLETAAACARQPDGDHDHRQLQPRRKHFGPPADYL